LRHEKVISIENIDNAVSVVTDGSVYTASFAFNSILFTPPVLRKTNYYLLQHFKGWVIETEESCFNTEQATLMDFRVGQDAGTTFVYVMPFSEKTALVEYTLFSHEQLTDEAYNEGLSHYISTFLGIKSYRIREEEFGIIPMTDFDFPKSNGRIINIGTAGGQTKPSSGYTFKFIQKHVAALVNELKQSGRPYIKQGLLIKRFMWYDKVLLHMLHYKKMPGARIFSLLFKRNRIGRIFKFLDNETSIFDELYLLNTLPQLPFMKAGFRELTK
jgi:lycopene beta-cyclase